jgi:hypothetical protein
MRAMRGMGAALGLLAALLPIEVARASESLGCEVRVASVDAANIATFRGECRWRVAPQHVTTVLTDPVRLAASSTALEESRRLADGRLLNIQKTGWPMDDRQSTLEVRDAPRADGGVLRSFRLAAEQEPAEDGAVQTTVDEGSWLVSAAPGGGTQVVLTLRYEPGGNMPPSLVHKMSPQYIARGLDELRLAAEQLARSSSGADVAAGPPQAR